MAIILHLDNILMAGRALGAAGLTASSTASGYNKDNVRDPNLFTGWKASDSTTDEYLQFELDTALTNGGTYYWGMAVDQRLTTGGDRSAASIRGATSAGGAYTTLGTCTHSVGNSNGLICVGVGSFVAGAAYTHIRFVMNYSGSGTDKAPVLLYVGLVGTSFILDVTNTLILPTQRGLHTNVAVVRAVSMAHLTNRSATMQQEMEFILKAVPASDMLSLRIFFSRLGGGARCLFASGLDDVTMYNSGVAAGDCAIRIDGTKVSAVRTLRDLHDVQIPFVTEPYTLMDSD